MSCSCPVDAWFPREGASDKRLRFSPLGADDSRHIMLPCGKCAACRSRRAADWAVRCVHEAQMHDGVACFVTRTFDADHLPADWSVRKEVHQNFMKRLWRVLGFWPRNLSCGEYGEQNLRPHYHDILFGEDFRSDRVPLRKSQSGGVLYTSPRLSEAWPYGEAAIGEFNYDTAFYTAKYNVKLLRGESASRESLRRWDSRTGEEWFVEPPFLLMSRMPGLGATWFRRFGRDAFPSDFVVVEGRKMPVPAYYMRLLEKDDDALADDVREARRVYAFQSVGDRAERRLMTRHEIGLIRAARFAREPG